MTHKTRRKKPTARKPVKLVVISFSVFIILLLQAARMEPETELA